MSKFLLLAIESSQKLNKWPEKGNSHRECVQRTVFCLTVVRVEEPQRYGCLTVALSPRTSFDLGEQFFGSHLVIFLCCQALRVQGPSGSGLVLSQAIRADFLNFWDCHKAFDLQILVKLGGKGGFLQERDKKT